MKNYILFAILVALTAFTYYFEEVIHIGGSEEEEEKSKIINFAHLGEIKGLMTGKVDLVRRNGRYYFRKNKMPVDQDRLDQIFQVLSNIKVRKIIGPGESSQENPAQLYVPDSTRHFTFVFEEGEVVFTLGEKLAFDKSFYMEVRTPDETRLIIAYDSGVDEGIYGHEGHQAATSSFKYDRLKNLIDLEEDFFIDKHVFKNELMEKDKLIWREISLTNLRNRPFRILFLDGETRPRIHQGLTYSMKYFDLFFERLLHLEGDKVYYSPQADRSKLGDKIGTIELQKIDGRRQTLKLFHRYGNEHGNFLTTSFDDNIYQIGKYDVKTLFFSNKQDFWDLKYNTEFVSKKVTLSFKDVPDVNLTVHHGENFWVENEDKEGEIPKNSAFKELFALLGKRADYLTPLDIWGNEENKIMKNNRFSITFDGQKIHVIIQDRELLLYNQKYQYKLHHFIGKDSPVGYSVRDYFSRH